MRRVTLILALTIILILLAVIGLLLVPSPTPPAQRPTQTTPVTTPGGVVKIGFLGPVTTTYGTIALNSIKLAVEEINNAGGILGRRIEIVVFDDQNRPDLAVTGFRKLVGEDKVVAIFGIHSSAVGLALLPLIKEAKVPVFAMGAVADDIDRQVAENATLKYWFRFNVNASMHALMLTEPAKYIAQKFGFSKVGLLYDQHAWTVAVIKRAKAELEKAGLQIVFEGTIDPGKMTTFVPILSKARDAGVQILLVWSAYGDGKVLQRDYSTLKPPFVIIQFDVVGMGFLQWNATSGSLPYQIFAWYFFAETPDAVRFAKSYEQKYGRLMYFYPPYFMYDAVYAWKSAVERAGTFDGDAVADVLYKNGYKGVSGNWVFTRGHSPLFGPGYISTVAVQWTEDGKVVVVWPPNLATGEVKLPPWVK
ncbi:MAG: ABC transporter substrate-binding protein [Thermofilaceae archaeon]